MAPKNSKDVEVIDDATEKYLALVESPELMDPAVVTRNIVNRILSTEADDIESVLSLGDAATEDAKNIAGRPFVITALPDWYKSSFDPKDGGAGVFAAMPVMFLDTKREGVVTVGGQNVLAQLYVMQTRGMIPNTEVPVTFKVVQSARGFDVLWLTKGEAPF